MSNFENNENIENENTESEGTVTKRGQTKKTEAELREAFEASGVKGLLEVETTAKGNTRCTVRRVDGKKIKTIFGPCAGNTFLRSLEGAVKMGPYIAE